MLRFALKHTKRLIVGVIGVTIILIGIALLALPGPGLIVIIVGLAVLASEFVWAKRLLEQARGHYVRMKSKVVNRKSTNTQASSKDESAD